MAAKVKPSPKPSRTKRKVNSHLASTAGAAALSFLALLAALPYSMGGVADIFPASAKPWIAVVAGLAAGALKVLTPLLK